MNDDNNNTISLGEGRRRRNAAERAEAAAKAAKEGGEPAPLWSDEHLALVYAARHKDELRFVVEWGWMVFEKARGRWRRDNKLHPYNLARKLVREFSLQADNPKLADDLAAARTSAAIERMSRADPRLIATADQFDADPWLLNTPGGVIDLRTGALRAARREDYFTRCTAFVPAGECPMWLAFLDRITGGNKDLQRYLQLVAGYALTGSTREHALFLLYGTGANGKSVFIGVLVVILADYATVAPMETFIASNSDRHPTDVAGLQGARLVAALETEEGRRWNESRIAALTGGDKIAARFMRKDFFEFTPQFKLLVATNHKPGLRGVGEAMRRRMNLIPFTVTIPKEERDQTLKDKLLEAEGPGILQWAIDGCLDWAGEGLVQPKVVADATATYIDDEDAIGLWMEECCERGAQKVTTLLALFSNWRKWGEAAGEYVGPQKRFAQALDERNFERGPREAGTGRATFKGLGLKPSPDARPHPSEIDP